MPTVRFKGEYAHITLTTPKLKIFRPKINKAYFATAKIEAVTTTSTTKTVQETYVVAGGDTLSKIASKKGTTVAAIIESDAKLTQANKDSLRVGQKITLPNTVATTETNKKITFEKANEGALGSELYIVVETEGFQGYSVYVNIKQGKAKGIEEKDALVTFKDENGNYVTKAEIKVGALCESHYSNMDDYTDMAIYKLQIDHNDATKKEAWQKALEGKDKKTPLYLLVDGHTVPGQEEINVNYHGDSEGGEIRGEAIKNLWLDSDGNWFSLKKGCDCGKSLGIKFKCEDYSNFYGPYYSGSDKLDNFPNWGTLIDNGKLTKSKKNILIAVLNNEGKLDSVQSYDSEVVSVGAMQKTINKIGKGELPIQIKEFKVDFPKKYKELFENCGWTVEGKKMYYKDMSDSLSSKITGKELRKKIREGFNKKTLNTKIECKPLESLVKAAKDIDFQKKQIMDSNKRMEDSLNKKPVKAYTGSKKNKNITEKYSHKIKDFLKSNLGKALVFDHSINRPAYPIFDFGNALNDFFKEKDKAVDDYNKGKEKKDFKLKISRNPNNWGDNHEEYEKKIIELYGPNRDMTHSLIRYNKLKTKL